MSWFQIKTPVYDELEASFYYKSNKNSFYYKNYFYSKSNFYSERNFYFFHNKKTPTTLPPQYLGSSCVVYRILSQKGGVQFVRLFQFGVAFVEFLPILLGIGGATQHFQNIIYDKIPSTLMPQTAYWLVLKKNDLIIFHSELYLLSASYEVNVSYLL